MRYGTFLQKGGTIGFVAPSFGCSIEPYKTAFGNAQLKWEKMGYALDIGPNCYANEGIGISNTPEACGKEFMSYYQSKDNDCLISCGGGELMCEILEYIDFQQLKTIEPKLFMGYSDNTNLSYLLATICEVASIYGPCAATFGMEPWHESLQDAMDILTGHKNKVSGYDKWEMESLKNEENPLTPYHVTEPRVLQTFCNQKGNEEITFDGRLLGGCLDCLRTLIGTKFDYTKEFIDKYKEDGIIWCIESCELNVFDIRRTMWQMEQAGWFEHAKGFLIGRPLVFGQELMGLDAYQAILEIAGKKNIPVIMDIDMGHLPPMMPIVIGSVGHVKVAGNEIELTMEMI